MQGSKIPRLIHIQTTSLIEFPEKLTIIRIGKPSADWTPDIDLSNFPNSDIVSHSHLEICIQGNSYFIEDLGSANGTYLNYSRLTPFTSCQLRFGDRVDLGKNEYLRSFFEKLNKLLLLVQLRVMP
jgi:pSer/pThr/pTyr-binding forkhead associated (FHA) protein